MKILTTDEFWEAMCDATFIRISLLHGRLNGEDVMTLEAPEQVEGFIESKIYDIDKLLNPDRPKIIQKLMNLIGI